MNKQTEEILSGFIYIDALSIPLKVGFRIISPAVIAGGPLEVEAFLINNSTIPLKLFVSGDMIKSRFAHYAFEAFIDENLIVDPTPASAYLGGPQGGINVSAGETFIQTILLNDYLKLEDAQTYIPSGVSKLLKLICHWNLKLSAKINAAQFEHELTVSIPLAVVVVRNDGRLEKLSAKLYADVLLTPVNLHSLNSLLAMRSAAMVYIEKLLNHQDPNIAAQAQNIYNSLSQ
ncbi:MAG: hypothetical protein EOP46_02105 [Sphingobacteriaceae bacterium]|nr:MAG: hypothetical protein EOP46_02105 [Sphingobacteriaceae bacterium]